MNERYDERAMLLKLEDALPGVRRNPEWLLDALIRRLSIEDAMRKWCVFLAGKVYPGALVDPDEDTVLEHQPSCSQSDTTVL